MSAADHDLTFPDNFLWGVATASYQVEGNNTNCQWYEWEQLGHIASDERAGDACDWWRSAEHDFDRAASLHLNSLRLSLEWSRIEPEPGRYSDTAIARYRQMLQALRERGIEPLVTLHHFTNPLWLERIGAFENDPVVPLFARYARFCVEQLGDLCNFWCTINEPNTYAVAGYLLGAWPPGRKGDMRAYFVVQANLLRAHAAAYWAIHAVQAQARVGLAHNMPLFDPLDPRNPLDRMAATGQDATFNGPALEALALGQAPLLCQPFVGDLSAVRDTFDYLGLNYYTRRMVAFDLSNPGALFSRHLTLPATEHMEPVACLATGETFGEIYPEGLHRVLRRLSTYGKPIYITENGFADGLDAQRPRALVRTVDALHVAIAEGAPVRERRLAAGIPGGGRFGPTYGYRWPDKNGAKTNDTFVEVAEESAIMRELYARISTGTSARELARELDARGVPTPSGEGDWSASQIIRLIRNPIYCGRGRTKRWETVRMPVVDSETREVYDYATSRDRMRRETYVEETYPIDPSRAPALVTPEVWNRANAALVVKKNFYGKLGRWNSPHPVEATLLHGGYVRCARCGAPMVRQWNAVAGAPRYRCPARGNNPNHPCRTHDITAVGVDDLTLKTIAATLTDPEQVLALADKADAQAAGAADAVEMVETKLAVQRDLAAEIERARADHLVAIAALGALAGHEDMVSRLRAELVQLDRDAAAANAAHARALPEQERAARRQRMLERLSRFRNQQTWVNVSAGTVEVTGDGERVLKRTLDLGVAADLLGMSADEVRALGLHTVARDEEGWVEEIKTEEVLYRLFKNAPHERLRQMVDDLGVRVYVAPPWTKEERAVRGLTPLAERVTVRLLDPKDCGSRTMPSAIV